jgi:hypothetical protein
MMKARFSPITEKPAGPAGTAFDRVHGGEPADPPVNPLKKEPTS